MLRILLTLSMTVALASAGGKTLSAQESRQFLDLFRRYCPGPGSPPSQDGNTFFYCKFADNGPITEEVSHDADIASGETPKQVVFVQPPSYNYIHNVALRGNPGSPQQTEIYVLPPTADHTLQVQDTRASVDAQKPNLYFLSSDHQGGGSQGSTSFGASQSQSLSSSSSLSRPSPVGRPNQRPSGGSLNLRPSAPSPSTGINAIAGGYDQGGSTSFYGAPARNQRNVNYNIPYTTIV